MYLVKLDMSVKGIPVSVTRHLRRHFCETFDCLMPDTAIRKALDSCSSSSLAKGACRVAGYVNYVVQYDHGIATGDVSLVRRYTVFNCDGKRVMSAVFTDYFDFV